MEAIWCKKEPKTWFTWCAGAQTKIIQKNTKKKGRVNASVTRPSSASVCWSAGLLPFVCVHFSWIPAPKKTSIAIRSAGHSSTFLLIAARLKSLFKSGWDRHIIHSLNGPNALLLEGKGWWTRRPHKLSSLSIAQCCKTFDGICVTRLSRRHLPQAFTVVLWQGHRHLVQVPGVSGSTAGACKAPGNTIYHCHKANHPRQRGLPISGDHDTH